MLRYDDLVRRNVGYVSNELQQRIRETCVLVAGCGIGSTFAESAVRIGFEQMILADGDTVAAHNLNRQNFTASDIGRPKVDALADRLSAINPAVRLRRIRSNLDRHNTADAVEGADFVFDTIDFLDLAAIVGLHDECMRQGKPAISALAMGWGAGCVYFPPRGEWSFRRLFRISEDQVISAASYRSAFAPLAGRVAERLEAQVATALSDALAVMEDGAPCPASQVSPGAQSVAALATTLLISVLAGRVVNPAPALLVTDPLAVFHAPGIDLSE